MNETTTIDADGTVTTVRSVGSPPATAVATADGGLRAERGDTEPVIIPILGILFPVLIVAIVAISRLARTRMAVRHGYPIKVGKDWIKPADGPDAKRAQELLAAENERLKAQVSRLEERLAVVERIVTDPARRVAAEIDALR